MGIGRRTLWFLVLVLPWVGFAGGSTGGGNVMICKDPETGVETHRLLDYYEAELLTPDLKRDLGKGKTEKK